MKENEAPEGAHDANGSTIELEREQASESGIMGMIFFPFIF